MATSQKDSQRNPPRTKQDNQGKDNRGGGPLGTKDGGRKGANRLPKPGEDPRATNRGDRDDQPAASTGRPTYGGG